MDDRTTGWRPVTRYAFNQIEHGLYIALAVLLCLTCVMALAGSALALVEGLGAWAKTETVFDIIDRLLVVLMLVEILHTVLVSVRSGSLTAEPFLIVGLIASIRRILVITLETQRGGGATETETFQSSMIELGVLGMLILVMVVSIHLLRRLQAQDADKVARTHEPGNAADPHDPDRIMLGKESR